MLWVIRCESVCKRWILKQKHVKKNWKKCLILRNCMASYLSFEHVSNEEHHHAGVDFVFLAPLEPSWHRLSKLTPNIVRWHNHQNEYHFCGQNDLRQQEVYSGWVIVGTFNRNLWISLIDDARVFFKGFSVTAWITEMYVEKKCNDKKNTDVVSKHLIWLADYRHRYNNAYTIFYIPILEFHDWSKFGACRNILFTGATANRT